MKIGPFEKLGFISINVTDWQKAKKFYGETLGLPLVMDLGTEAGWMEFGEKDGTHLAINLWRGPDPLPPSNGSAVAIFSVMDAYETVKELRKRGVRCDDVIAIPQMVTYASFYDPEGNILQIAGPAPKM